ncbi:hypothetical protein GCM10017562_62820 [Streptomyces roseofulvus]
MATHETVVSETPKSAAIGGTARLVTVASRKLRNVPAQARSSASEARRAAGPPAGEGAERAPGEGELGEEDPREESGKESGEEAGEEPGEEGTEDVMARI